MKTETETVVPEQECRKVARLIRIAIGIEIVFGVLGLLRGLVLGRQVGHVDEALGWCSLTAESVVFVVLFLWLARAIKRRKNWARVTFIFAAVVQFAAYACYSYLIVYPEVIRCCCRFGKLPDFGWLLLAFFVFSLSQLLLMFACAKLLRKRTAQCFVKSRGGLVRASICWILVIGTSLAFARVFPSDYSCGKPLFYVGWTYLRALSGDFHSQSKFLELVRSANGRWTEWSYAKSIEWNREAAKRGNEWGAKRELARLGDKEAQHDLAWRCYANGRYDEAVWWFRTAAKRGDKDAQYMLGMLYEEGKGVKQSYEKALKWYRKAAEQGFGAGMYGIGGLYEKGRGIAQSYEEAAKWYMKAAEQEDEDAAYAAAYRLGVLYEKGNGVAQSYEKTAEWYMKAAEGINAEAARRLGELYEKGIGVAQSCEKAAEWYAKAVENYDDDGLDVDIACKLGAWYEKGEGVKQSFEEATEWYRRAAGKVWGSQMNDRFWGGGYFDSCPSSLKELVDKTIKAARSGNRQAQRDLGGLYRTGAGNVIKQSYEEAAKWYRKAAEQGYVVAYFELQGLYEQGKIDEKAYVEWLRKTAEQGLAWAQFELGRLHEGGDGVPKSYEEAIKWYRKAIDGFRKQFKAFEMEEEEE